MWHKIEIIGNLGKDPEMRYTPSGQAVTSFSVATSRQYKSGSGELVKETIWLRVSAWGKLAETCHEYLKQGAKVLVEGRLTPDKATGSPRVYTKGDGTPAASFEVTASSVIFLDPKSKQGDDPASIAEDEHPF